MIGALGPGQEAPPSGCPRVGVIGCGDVAYRHYLPALEALADKVELAGCCDARAEAADRAVAGVRSWAPAVRPFVDPATMIAEADVQAVLNLTPAPLHGRISQACLEASAHVYAEKPLASTLAEADTLIDTARERGLHLLCAPGEAVSARTTWLREISDSGRLGPLTLAVAHHADSGPATWREYTGDPSVFYAEGVGPVFDHGIYRLHLLTSLLGPVAAVQAMGAIGSPERTVVAGPLAGRTIPVTTPDHVLINLRFAGGALGQLLASFGTAATQAPWLELHFTRGTISFARPSWERDATASIYHVDDSPLGLEGWVHGLRPPPPAEVSSVVELGVAHFVGVIRGETAPVLTAEHARHVLDVILKSYASVDDGLTHETETTF